MICLRKHKQYVTSMKQIIERSTQDLDGSIICKASSTIPAIPHKAKMTYITVLEIPSLVFLIGIWG